MLAVMAIGDGFDDALDRARAGDTDAFRVLWTRLQPHLRRYLKGLGCDDIDDVASETWLQAIRDVSRFTGDGKDFRAWLFTIGRHRAIDTARSRSRSSDKLPAHALTPAPEPRYQPVEDEVLYRLSSQRTAMLLASLSRDQATVVLLRVIAGLDTENTARMLGKSPGAIRGCLHRGLRALSVNPRVILWTAGEDTVQPSGQPLPAANGKSYSGHGSRPVTASVRGPHTHPLRTRSAAGLARSPGATRT